MKTLLIEPLAPWVFRSGRPFGQGGDAATLPFPWPSTLAGALRTAYGDARGLDFADAEVQETLRAMAMQGPLVVGAQGPLFPKPADALYLEEAVIPLIPGGLKEGEWTDLPKGLAPIFPAQEVREKPAGGPGWWGWQPFIRWLRGEGVKRKGLGWDGPVSEPRTHVRIDPDTQAADEGLLFRTRGWAFKEHRLLVRFPKAIQGPLRVGGDGRLGHIHPAEESLWPSCPQDLAQALATARRVRMVLVTPALFKGGWRPGWLDQTYRGTPPSASGAVLRLKAACIPRWEAHSGWDLAQDKPRATRRLVPAGAVYWFEVEEGRLGEGWLAPVSDADSKDGFGLAAWGLW